LTEAGHRVTVICEFPNHPHGIVPPEYRGRLVEDDRSRAHRVLRVWVKANPEKTQRTRLAFYLSYAAMATAVAPRAGRADVVLATSPPLFTALAGVAVAKLNNAPFVLDIRDLWPAAAVSLGQMSGGAPLRVAEALERYLYREATAVAAVTRPFCEHIDRMRGRPPRAVYLPNGTLERFFETGEPAERTLLGGADGAFVVTFAGTHGIAQGLPSVLDAAEQSSGSLHFAFVGDGPLKEQLVESAQARGLANVSFARAVPPEQVVPILAASDALLVPLSSQPLFADFIPSKLFDALAVGKPVLLAAQGESARLLERSGGGIAVPPENPDELARAARWLSEHLDESAAMGRRGREFARAYLRSEQARRLEELLLDVTGR
jgi:glycosyltransferase involved in cell wall biosynthesis